MITIQSLLQSTTFECVQGDLSMEVRSLTFDSRQAKTDSVFFAILGTLSDGHSYVQSAYDLGCRMFVVQKHIELP